MIFLEIQPDFLCVVLKKLYIKKKWREVSTREMEESIVEDAVKVSAFL